MSTSLIIRLGVCLILVGCSSNTAPNSMSAPLASTAAGASGPADESERCPPGLEQFHFGPNGLARTDAASGMMARIVAASESPPVRGYNDWTIAVTDMVGAPMPQAMLRWACAWMPAHVHGSNPKRVMSLGNGQFELDQQNLAMYGGWQVKLWIDAAGTGAIYQPQSGGIVGGDACKGPGAGALPNIVFDICVPTSRE